MRVGSLAGASPKIRCAGRRQARRCHWLRPMRAAKAARPANNAAGTPSSGPAAPAQASDMHVLSAGRSANRYPHSHSARMDMHVRRTLTVQMSPTVPRQGATTAVQPPPKAHVFRFVGVSLCTILGAIGPSGGCLEPVVHGTKTHHLSLDNARKHGHWRQFGGDLGAIAGGLSQAPGATRLSNSDALPARLPLAVMVAQGTATRRSRGPGDSRGGGAARAREGGPARSRRRPTLRVPFRSDGPAPLDPQRPPPHPFAFVPPTQEGSPAVPMPPCGSPAWVSLSARPPARAADAAPRPRWPWRAGRGSDPTANIW